MITEERIMKQERLFGKLKLAGKVAFAALIILPFIAYLDKQPKKEVKEKTAQAVEQRDTIKGITQTDISENVEVSFGNLPGVVERQKRFWGYVFSEVDTGHSVLFDMGTYEIISKGNRRQMTNDEAAKLKYMFNGSGSRMMIKEGLKGRLVLHLLGWMNTS